MTDRFLFMLRHISSRSKQNPVSAVAGADSTGLSGLALHEAFGDSIAFMKLLPGKSLGGSYVKGNRGQTMVSAHPLSPDLGRF